jgi:hypothetical protein
VAKFTKRRTRGLVQRCEAGNPGPPDFLWNLVALANFMRLSLLKGARAASSSAARQEIRVREMAKKCELSELIRLLREFFGFGGLSRSSFTVLLGRSRLFSCGARAVGTGWSMPGVVLACGRGVLPATAHWIDIDCQRSALP